MPKISEMPSARRDSTKASLGPIFILISPPFHYKW
jgi:hypothetical protein